MSNSYNLKNIVMVKIRRRIWCSLIVLHIFVKTGCSAICGNSCCVNFYQISKGACIECPMGTHGVNCTGKCVTGFYGKLCQSACNCPAESCDASHGCLKENAVEGKESTSEWVNVTYALIASVTMSLIGLLFFLKSWFSETNASSTVTNQVYLDQSVNQEEQVYESRRSSSSNAAENVLPRAYDHPDQNNYTDLIFSQMQPIYDNSKDRESVPEPEAPFVDSIPSHEAINGHKKDDDDEVDCKREYEQIFKNEWYNVLSLRKPSIEKTITLRSVDSSFNFHSNTDGMEDEYDSIEMKEKNKEECAPEIRKIKSELSGKEVCQESATDETTKNDIENAILNQKFEMIVDNETNALKTISISKSFTVREFDRPKGFVSRPYSLSKSIWCKHHTSERSKQTRISDYEEVSPLQTDNENKVDKLKCSESNIQSNTENAADQQMAVVSIENENKNPSNIFNYKEDECQEAYQEKDSFEDESHKYTKGKNESSEPDPSYEYSQVQKRPQLRFNDSSTLSVKLLSEDGKISTKM